MRGSNQEEWPGPGSWRRVLQHALGIIYPPPDQCLLCDQLLPDSDRLALCTRCREAIADSRCNCLICSRCGKFLEIAESTRPAGTILCFDCRRQDHPFVLARSVGPYEGLLKQGIEKYKFHGCRELSVPFGRMMAEIVASDPGFIPSDLVVPVPLHQERLQERAFNQAELLAAVLARELLLPSCGSLLTREVKTGAQSRLGRAQRRYNLAGAFRVANPRLAAARNILLVDDIYTTGATAGECSRVLLAAGAARVCVITLATGKQGLGPQ